MHLEEGVLYSWGDGRHGKLALKLTGGDSSHSEYLNEYIPLAVRRFEKFFVQQVFFQLIPEFFPYNSNTVGFTL